MEDIAVAIVFIGFFLMLAWGRWCESRETIARYPFLDWKDEEE
jgi:hypothetical protein